VAAVLRLDAAIAAATGDRFVLRRAATSGPSVLGGVILDPLPAQGVSRRRQTPERVAALAAAAQVGDHAAVEAARIELHGIVTGAGDVAPDVRVAAAAAALDAVRAHHAARPGDDGPTLAAVRSAASRALRRQATTSVADASARASMLVDELVSEGRLVRDGDRVRAPDHEPAAADPEVAAAMDRLVAALDVPAPPPLGEAAAAAGCPPAAIRELERNGRIVVLDDDLGYAMATYRDLAAKALALAAREPLAPAAFRDATGTTRRYVVPILEDLDRRGILRRTPAGHVPGPRAPAGARGGT
jgi:selenocysteine-specific elongation factor